MFSLTSCDDDPILNVENPNQSSSAKTAMQTLKGHFNSDGSLRTSENPTTNIIFDYGFEFEYPVTLSYNTSASVSINNFDNLKTVVIEMNDNLYINGIAFPFNVHTYNKNTNAIVLKTINNETEFENLLDTSRSNDDCICTTEYVPVCVVVRGPNGQDQTIQYSNACEAICDDFTQNDFINCDTTCIITGLSRVIGDCNSDGTYSLTIDFYHENAGDTSFDVYLRNQVLFASYSLENLPITIPNFALSGSSTDYIRVSINDNTDCYDESEWNAPDCNNPCNGNEVAAPTGDSSQDFCTADNSTLADVQVTGANLIFWDNITDGNQLPQTMVLTNGIEVWVSQGISDCAERLEIAINVSSCACWEFVYPITINGGTTINNVDEFRANYTPTSSLDYPFDVVMDGQTSTINTPNNFFEIGELNNMCN